MEKNVGSKLLGKAEASAEGFAQTDGETDRQARRRAGQKRTTVQRKLHGAREGARSVTQGSVWSGGNPRSRWGDTECRKRPGGHIDPGVGRKQQERGHRQKSLIFMGGSCCVGRGLLVERASWRGQVGTL